MIVLQSDRFATQGIAGRGIDRLPVPAPHDQLNGPRRQAVKRFFQRHAIVFLRDDSPPTLAIGFHFETESVKNGTAMI